MCIDSVPVEKVIKKMRQKSTKSVAFMWFNK